MSWSGAALNADELRLDPPCPPLPSRRPRGSRGCDVAKTNPFVDTLTACDEWLCVFLCTPRVHVVSANPIRDTCSPGGPIVSSRRTPAEHVSPADNRRALTY